MSQLWFFLLYQPIINALIFLYKIFGGNLGLAIIGLTVLIRVLIIPMMKPQLRAAKKMQEIAPQLQKLKEKHMNDKHALMKAQAELYKKEGINPATGCLPQIIQFLVLIALFQAFSQVLKPDGVAVIERLNQVLYSPLKLPSTVSLNLKFLWLDLSKPDLIKIPSFPPLPGIFLILSVVIQFLSSKMMMPQTKIAQEQAKKTKEMSDDLSSAMQTQMLYMFPLMTLLVGLGFPSGLVLYWLVFSLTNFFQQYLIFGKKEV